jgi:hypothetical protein
MAALVPQDTKETVMGLGKKAKNKVKRPPRRRADMTVDTPASTGSHSDLPIRQAAEAWQQNRMICEPQPPLQT